MRAVPRIFFFCIVASAVPTAMFGRAAAQDVPDIQVNDNRLPHGQLKDGVLTIEVEARLGLWHPEDRDGPSLQVQAFAEAGHSLEIPGPLIRVPEGTEISVDIRNTIEGATLVVHGPQHKAG